MTSRPSLRQEPSPRDPTGRRRATRVAVRNAPKISRRSGRWRSVSPSSESSESSSGPLSPTAFQTTTRDRRSSSSSSSNDAGGDGGYDSPTTRRSGSEVSPDDVAAPNSSERLASPTGGEKRAPEAAAAAAAVATKKTVIAGADGERKRESTVAAATPVDAKSNRKNERDRERPRAAKISPQTKVGVSERRRKRLGGRTGEMLDPQARPMSIILPPLPPAARSTKAPSSTPPPSLAGDRTARPPFASRRPRDAAPIRSGTLAATAARPQNPIAVFKEKIQKRAAAAVAVAAAAASSAGGISISAPTLQTTPAVVAVTIVATRDYASDYRRLLLEMERELQLDVRRLLRAWIATMIVFENELPTFYRGVSLADLAVLATLLDNAFAVTFDRSSSGSGGGGGGGGDGGGGRKNGDDRAQTPTVSKIRRRSKTTLRRDEGGDGAADADAADDERAGRGNREGDSDCDIDDDDDELGSYLEDYELAQNLSWLGANEIFFVCLLATKNVVDVDETVMLPSNASAFSSHIAAVLANFYRGFVRRPSRGAALYESVGGGSGGGGGGSLNCERTAKRGETQADGDEEAARGDDEVRRDDSDADLAAVFAGQRGFMMRALTSMHLHALDYTKPFVFGDLALSASPSTAPTFDCADAKLVDAIARKLGRAVRRSDYAHVSDHDQLLLPPTPLRTTRRDAVAAGLAKFEDSGDPQRGGTVVSRSKTR